MPQGYGGRKKFWDEFDKLTIGEILKEAVKGDQDFRQEIVKREQQGRNRNAVIEPLVNWNS